MARDAGRVALDARMWVPDPETNDAMVDVVLRWAARSGAGTSGAVDVCAALGLSLAEAQERTQAAKP